MAYVNVVTANTIPFASKGSLGYHQHCNPTSTEHTSIALPLEPSGLISPSVLYTPNSQTLWTITSKPNLLCHKTVITWLKLPTFLSTRRLDVEGKIRWQVGGASVTSWGEIQTVNPGNFSCGLSKHVIERRAPRPMAGYPVRTNSLLLRDSKILHRVHV